MSTPSWYILVVRPGMEQAAAAAVARFGWEVFLPGYRTVVAKHSRQRGGKKTGEREERAFPSWPGYLWAGATDVRAMSQSHGLERILRLHLVAGVIMDRRTLPGGRIEAWPVRLPANWRRDKKLRTAEDIALAETARPAPPGPDYAIDDDVIITMEAFHQWPAKCVFLDGEKNIARVVISFLGGDRAVTIAADAAVRSRSGPA
jgi:hypothetical protein